MKNATGIALALAVVISIAASSISVRDARKNDKDGRLFWATISLLGHIVLGGYISYKTFRPSRDFVDAIVAGVTSVFI